MANRKINNRIAGLYRFPLGLRRKHQLDINDEHLVNNYMTKALATGIPRTFGGAIFAMALVPLIVRNIGMEKYGTWTLLFIFLGLSASLDIGIPKVLVYLIPKEKNRDEVNRIFTASVFIVCCMMFLVLSIALALIYLRVPVWGSDATISISLSNLLLMSGANIVCCGLLHSLCSSLLEAHYKIHIVNIVYLALTLLNYSVVFITTIFSSRVEHLIYGTNLVYIVIAVLSVILAKRCTEIRLSSLRFFYIRTILLRGKDFFAIGLITSVFWPLMRYLVVLLSADMAACGIYDISLKIAVMASSALTCFSIPLFSLFSGYGKENIVKIKHVIFRMTCLLAFLFVFGVSTYMLIGGKILEFAFDKYDARLFNISLILLVGAALPSVFDPFVRALWALGHTKKCAVIRFFMLIVNISLFFLLAFITEPLHRISFAIALSLSAGGLSYFVVFYRLYGFRMDSAKVLRKTDNV